MLAPKDPIRARWINSHDILIHAREGDLSELILASTDWQKPIRRLQPEEEMVSAAPNGKAYLTRQLNRIESKMTPEVKVSWTVTFQDLEGKTINSTVIPRDPDTIRSKPRRDDHHRRDVRRHPQRNGAKSSHRKTRDIPVQATKLPA